MQALGCTLAALTPHSPPGALAAVDQGVQALIAELQTAPQAREASR